MKWLLLLFLGLPAFPEVGETYEDIHKRLGEAHVHWTEGRGVTVYCHGPKTFFPPSTLQTRVESHAPKEMRERFYELTRIPRDIDWEQHRRLQKDIDEMKRPGWMLAYMVQGVCLAEEYFLPTAEAARTIIGGQRNGKGMGDVERSAEAFWPPRGRMTAAERFQLRQNMAMAESSSRAAQSGNLDWSAEDGRTAHYSSYSQALVVTHPQWPGPPLKARLAPGPSFICGTGLLPQPSNLELLLEDKPWAVKEPRPEPDKIPDPAAANSTDPTDTLLLEP